MRLGGPIFEDYADPASWAKAVRSADYRAAHCPVGPDADADEIDACAEAARKADIVIAEVGAWSNPLSPDESERKEALRKCKDSLHLADQIGAQCCVNIAGSRGEIWHGPCPQDLTEETFQMIVETVRDIIDSVKPSRSCYALETMPRMYPDSADSYLRLMRAIDREGFGVHFDPVNLIRSPQHYFHNDDVIRECFDKLGPHMLSCHAKDILLHDTLTVHLDEVRPGTGHLDYGTFFREASKLSPDLPLMMEHLPSAEEYNLAAGYLRSVAQEEGVGL